MAENTQTAGTANTPNSFGWCAWHEGHARGVRLISAQETGSSSGIQISRFACRPCREAYDLVPLADQL